MCVCVSLCVFFIKLKLQLKKLLWNCTNGECAIAHHLLLLCLLVIQFVWSNCIQFDRVNVNSIALLLLLHLIDSIITFCSSKKFYISYIIYLCYVHELIELIPTPEIASRKSSFFVVGWLVARPPFPLLIRAARLCVESCLRTFYKVIEEVVLFCKCVVLSIAVVWSRINFGTRDFFSSLSPSTNNVPHTQRVETHIFFPKNVVCLDFYSQFIWCMCMCVCAVCISSVWLMYVWIMETCLVRICCIQYWLCDM